MEPMTMAAIAAAPAIGGVVGNLLGKSDRKRAQQMIAEAYAELASVGLPPDLSKEIIYEQFQSAGILTPELEQDLGEVHSQLAGYKEKESNLQAQQEALNALKQRSQQGLSMEDRMALGEVRGQAQRDAEAKRQQILQNMAARGQGGSGAELAAQLQASQAAADTQSRENLNIAAQAQKAALDALANRGQLAGQIRGQDLDVARSTLGAADTLAQFNMQNSLGRQQRNVGNLNQAQVSNLANKQQIMSANTQLANQEKLRQMEEKGRLYDRTLDYKTALANAKLGQAANYQQKAAGTASMFSGIGSGIGSGLQAYATYGKNKPSTGDYTDQEVKNFKMSLAPDDQPNA